MVRIPLQGPAEVSCVRGRVDKGPSNGPKRREKACGDLQARSPSHICRLGKGWECSVIAACDSCRALFFTLRHALPALHSLVRVRQGTVSTSAAACATPEKILSFTRVLTLDAPFACSRSTERS